MSLLKNLHFLCMTVAFTVTFTACSDQNGKIQASVFKLDSVKAGNQPANSIYYNVPVKNPITLYFSQPVNKDSIEKYVGLANSLWQNVKFQCQYADDERKTIAITPDTPLKFLQRYTLHARGNILSEQQQRFKADIRIQLFTAIDTADKFPRLTEDKLLDEVQRQTFRYFWEHAHPVSGMARERNTSNDIVTTGGTGFALMTIITAIHRKFITRQEGIQRINKIVRFLDNKVQQYHGAFAHWINGATGKTIAFTEKDNGGDLVETAFLLQGMLCAREYFKGADPAEVQLRTTINKLWHAVEWDWFRQNDQNALYWHWSKQAGWEMNARVEGWNEALVTYVLAAASPMHSIPAEVYHEGWARNGAMKNGASYYGIQLPLGPAFGGPLFFEHYSFLGIDPRGLKDRYADYEQQAKNHTLINYRHCVENPKKYFGYSQSCWGITASDNREGYNAHEPAYDLGVIAPTASLSSFPFTPTESMQALNFFYYKLGDSLFREYGFVDAFNLSQPWFARSYLAIDQGPIIIMIENYRSGLLWNLFTGAHEIRKGMKKLGFEAPYLVNGNSE